MQKHAVEPEWEGVHHAFAPVPGCGLSLRHAGRVLSRGGTYYCGGGYCALHIITHGGCTVRTIDGARSVMAQTELGAGDLFCILPGGAIEYFCAPKQPWVFYWLVLEGEGVDALTHDSGFTPEQPWGRPDNPAAVEAVFTGIFQALKQKQPVSAYWIAARLYQLGDLCAGARRVDYRLGLVRQAQEIIRAQLHLGLNVNALAELLHVDRTTLFQAFKRDLGCPVVEYLRRERVARAKEMLQLGHDKLSVVAHSCGFSNVKYFQRAFKELTGLTPGAFRSGQSSSIGA